MLTLGLPALGVSPFFGLTPLPAQIPFRFLSIGGLSAAISASSTLLEYRVLKDLEGSSGPPVTDCSLQTLSLDTDNLRM